MNVGMYEYTNVCFLPYIPTFLSTYIPVSFARIDYSLVKELRNCRYTENLQYKTGLCQTQEGCFLRKNARKCGQSAIADKNAISKQKRGCEKSPEGTKVI